MAGEIGKGQLAWKTDEDVAEYSYGYVRGSGNVIDTETVTIGTRIYEFDFGGVVTPGNIAVTMGGAGPWSPTAALTALRQVINNDALCVADSVLSAVGIGVNHSLLLIGREITTTFALATTGINLVVSAANAVVGAAADDQFLAAGTHAITAEEVLSLAAGNEIVIGSINNPGSAPQLRGFFVQTAAGFFKSNATIGAHWQQVNTDDYALVVSDPVAVMVNTDEISWMCRA